MKTIELLPWRNYSFGPGAGIIKGYYHGSAAYWRKPLSKDSAKRGSVGVALIFNTLYHLYPCGKGIMYIKKVRSDKQFKLKTVKNGEIRSYIWS